MAGAAAQANTITLISRFISALLRHAILSGGGALAPTYDEKPHPAAVAPKAGPISDADRG